MSVVRINLSTLHWRLQALRQEDIELLIVAVRRSGMRGLLNLAIEVYGCSIPAMQYF